jgi:hypothetical protein
MIRVESLSDTEWLVTVEAERTTEHRVRISAAELNRHNATADQLLKASFRFLLDREPNTSILPSFELSIIERYYPEYRQKIADYLRGDEPR